MHILSELQSFKLSGEAGTVSKQSVSTQIRVKQTRSSAPVQGPLRSHSLGPASQRAWAHLFLHMEDEGIQAASAFQTCKCFLIEGGALFY